MHEAAGLYLSMSANDLEGMPLDDSNLLIASLNSRQVGVFFLGNCKKRWMPL